MTNIKFFRKMSSSLRHGGTKKPVFYLSINSDPNEHISILSKQKDGTMKNVPCPVIGQQYNRFMFGVDRADQLRMQYSICCKSKKWCRYLLWFLVDLADVNDSIYLDGALCRGWGGDTYVQVEQHNIER